MATRARRVPARTLTMRRAERGEGIDLGWRVVLPDGRESVAWWARAVPTDDVAATIAFERRHGAAFLGGDEAEVVGLLVGLDGHARGEGT